MINAGKTDWKGRSENECKKEMWHQRIAWNDE